MGAATDRLVLASSRAELAASNSRRKRASIVARNSSMACGGASGSSLVG